VKTAIVMQLCGVDAPEAARLLRRAGGRLGEVLGQER
jgi:N-acetylmuramic acid 6-phosphate (MurNAc-6-P) etherase